MGHEQNEGREASQFLMEKGDKITIGSMDSVTEVWCKNSSEIVCQSDWNSSNLMRRRVTISRKLFRVAQKLILIQKNTYQVALIFSH